MTALCASGGVGVGLYAGMKLRDKLNLNNK